MRTDEQKALLNYIKASAVQWWAYRKWIIGPKQVRQHFMKQAMRDMVMASVLYRISRKKGLPA